MYSAVLGSDFVIATWYYLVPNSNLKVDLEQRLISPAFLDHAQPIIRIIKIAICRITAAYFHDQQLPAVLAGDAMSFAPSPSLDVILVVQSGPGPVPSRLLQKWDGLDV